MSIYDRVRGGRPINPAVALYAHWHALLVGMAACKRNNTGQLIARSGYGDGWYNVSFHHDYGTTTPDLSDHPPINYGGMLLRKDGTFTLGSYHGWKQRDVIARHTFLRWGHVHGEYVWWVDTSAEEGSYSYRLQDWNNPVPYVAEKIAGGVGWRSPGPWLKLSWTGSAWGLDFHQEKVPQYTGYDPVDRAAWDHYIRLREKRYRRYERANLIRTGVLNPRQRAPRLTESEIEQRRDAAVQVIVAHMNITTPARTTPLRKTTEEVGLWEPSGCP